MALRTKNRKLSDLIDDNHEPVSELAAYVHNRIADWYCEDKTIDFFGATGIAAYQRTLPKECLSKARNFMYTYINCVRFKVNKPSLDTEWGKRLSGRKNDVERATRHAVAKGKQSGSIFGHKKDFAPDYDLLIVMCRCGWEATDKVHAVPLDALEGGMAIALYLLTGARGSELKKMVLQDMGRTKHQDTEAGEEFLGLRLMAHLNKTTVLHLNELMNHSHPWLCGIGLLGLSLLLRMKKRGTHPPFTMGVDEDTWYLFGTRTSTIDKRINEIYKCAASATEDGEDADTEKGYPVCYLGRHRGTILLQNQGGSKEGGEARTCHFSGGTSHQHYSGMPAPDMQRLTGTNPNNPRLAAHLKKEVTQAAADKVLAKYVPGYSAIQVEFAKVKMRMEEVRFNYTVDRAKAIRTVEMLCTRHRYLRSLIFACSTAVCCIVARPRTWKRWVIDESAKSLWQMRNPSSRAVWELFDLECDAACPEMDELSAVVRELEEKEIRLPLGSNDATTAAVKDAVVAERLRTERLLAEKDAQCLARMQAMHEQYRAFLQPMLVTPEDRARYDDFCASTSTLASITPAPPSATSSACSVASGSSAPVGGEEFLAGQSKKRTRVLQDPDDAMSVKSICQHITEASKQGDAATAVWVERALSYAVDDLSQREMRYGPSWRNQAKVRSKHFTQHCKVASEFGRFKSLGMSDAEARNAIHTNMQEKRTPMVYIDSLACDPKFVYEVLGVRVTIKVKDGGA